MLKKSNRLGNKGDFSFKDFEKSKNLFQKKITSSINFKIEKFIKSSEFPLCKVRIIIANKKVQSAVMRNKIKRQIKYFLIKNYNLFPKGKQEYIFIYLTKRQNKGFLYQDLEQEFSNML